MKKLVFLSLLLLSVGFSVSAQEKSELEKERQKIQQEMADLQKVYNQIKGQKNVSLNQANLVKRKLVLQERYLSNLNRELRLINDNIYLSTLEINRLKKQLDTLKSQYARSVVYAYKNRSTYDYLNFIFSAGSFNDAMKRIQYLKSYRSYREQQVDNIVETQKLIEKRIEEQNARKKEKTEVLKERQEEVAALQDQRKEKDAVVAGLKSQERKIQKQINDKKKKDAQLKNAIAAIVRREIEAAREEARKKAEAEAKANPKPATPATAETKPETSRPNRSYLDLNEADIALNNDFEKNKGKLPWPVDNGAVSIHFGSYQVEGMKIKGDNPGITIATPSGATVKSVFNGEVSAIFNMGDGMIVTIRHGKYFTVYSNLSSVSVSKGAKVSTGQVIGRAASSEDGNGGQIDFLLMIERQNVNPESWLR